MIFFDIIYYYFYTFYKKVDAEPHAMTVFAIGMCEGFFVNFIAQIFFAYRYCYFFEVWQMITIAVAFLVLNYFLFAKSGKGKRIAKNAPPFILSHAFSKILSLFFFIITASTLFFGPPLIKRLYENCR